MEQTGRVRAERVAEFLRRYLWARSRCVGGEATTGPLSELASRIQWGPCEFDGVRVELHLEPPFAWDRLKPKFFRAIIEHDDTAMPQLRASGFLGSWRDYVHCDGPMPKHDPVARFAPGSRASDRHYSERIDVV